jgi:hypothetical protein
MVVSPEAIEGEIALVGRSPRLIGHAHAELQRSLGGKLLLPIDRMDSAYDYECTGIGRFATAPPLPFRAIFQK